MRKSIWFACFLALQLFLSAQNNRPNIVLIVADDLGYGDLGCYGSTLIQTPVLDALAAHGARLITFYANAPECTPTRTALLTGRYQQRVGGLECAIGLGNVGRYDESKALSENGELGLPPRFNVLPKILKKKGYATALIGKWHLGDGFNFRPKAHGFDYSIGPLGGGVDYFHHTEPIGEFIGTYMEGDHDFYRNDKPHDRAGYYMTHLITDEAVEWINRQKENQPFFLYLPYTTPHQPLQGPDEYHPEPMTMDHWGKKDTAVYKKMIEDFDQGIGKIIRKLIEKGYDENTLIIFFSDNGPTTVGNTGVFSGNKGHVFEGGIRVPCIINWPGVIKPGITNTQMSISMDLTASICKILNVSPEHGLDGMDIITHLAEERADVTRTLFWRKRRGTHTYSAVRHDRFKYIREVDEGLLREHLFDLIADPAEKNNLTDAQPELLNNLRSKYQDWEKEVRAER